MKNLLILFLFIEFQIFSQQKIEVYFDFNKSEINTKCKLKLDSLLAANKSLEIFKIEGFCDQVDSHSYNDKLAFVRANAINEYLKNKNVSFSSNFQIKSIGENFKHHKKQSLNRKVVLYFSQNDLKTKFKSAHKGDFIKLKNINFYNNSNQFLPKTKPLLFELLKILQNNEILKIEIQGHICCKLPNEGEFVSEARAKAVYDFLVSNKIDKSRLQFKGFGVSKPIFEIPEQSEFEREENRRVEILILEN